MNSTLSNFSSYSREITDILFVCAKALILAFLSDAAQVSFVK